MFRCTALPRRNFSSASSNSAQASEKDILVSNLRPNSPQNKHNLYSVTLNRPKALHSLNLSMIRGMTPEYKAMQGRTDAVILQSSGGKAFCAGGDIRAIYDAKTASAEKKSSFFKEEYQLNNLIGNRSFPHIALMNGITMGGGVGVSVHGQFRVATENTLFAMPETAIGFFCDVGAMHVLSRMPGNLGRYLALTGARLKAAENLDAGIATHYIPAEKLPRIAEGLIAKSTTAVQDVEQLLAQLHEQPKEASKIKTQLEAIDRCFGKTAVEDIIIALEREANGGGKFADWAKESKELLLKMSPLSVKIALRHHDTAKTLKGLKDVLALDFRLALHFVEAHDFFEGVRALLVDKDKNPKWQPASFAQVSDAMVDKYFTPVPAERDLVL